MLKKNLILFVDDDPMVLQGLQRMLRSMRENWDMEFVSSGPRALEHMASMLVDVVVSDMMMPGMNGAELLNEVMRRSPQTARIILSGHADKELIMRCVGSTHQYLSKPCDSEVLKATIARACNLQGSLRSNRLRQLVGRMSRLPSIPALYTQLVENLGNPEVSTDRIAALIAQDIGMTAKILKLVNSAFFGLRRQISNAEEAVRYLGIDTLKALVLSLHVFSQFEGQELGGIAIDILWQHSLQTAALAKSIAFLETVDPKLADESFVAGMLHDAGKLVLADNFPLEYTSVVRRIKAEDWTCPQVEHRVFESDHAAVGAYLLGLWGLPIPIVEAIAWHHHPSMIASGDFNPLTAVHVANAMENARYRNLETAQNRWIDRDYLAVMGLAQRWAAWQSVGISPAPH
jgi:HD-like signal output (HDOD) protein/CheY-like chemotaxis protein